MAADVVTPWMQQMIDSIDEKAEVRATYANGREAKKPEVCQYFALCDRAANCVMDCGPVGQIPSCKRCASRMIRLGGNLVGWEREE